MVNADMSSSITNLMGSDNLSQMGFAPEHKSQLKKIKFDEWNNIPIPLTDALRIIVSEITFSSNISSNITNHLNQVQRKVVENLNIASDEAKKVEEKLKNKVDFLEASLKKGIKKIQNEIQKDVILPFSIKFEVLRKELEQFHISQQQANCQLDKQIKDSTQRLRLEFQQKINELKGDVF